MNGYSFLIQLKHNIPQELRAISRQYRATAGQLNGGTAMVNRHFKDVSTSVLGVKNNLRELGREKVKLSVDSTDVQRAYRELTRLRDERGRFAAGGHGIGTGRGGFASGGAGGALPGMGMGMPGYLKAGALLAGGGWLAKQVADREQTQLQYKLFTGSAETGNGLYKSLNRYADVTPFTNDEVLGAGRNLLSMGFDSKQIQPLLDKLGNPASALKIPLEEMAQVFGKMKGKGFSDTSDIWQFADRGIPILEYLSKTLHKSNDEILKMAENRQLKFEYIEGAFTRMSAKGERFHGVLEESSKLLGGKWSTVMGTASNQLTTFGDRFGENGGRLLDWLSDLQTHTPKTLDSLADLALSIGGVTSELTKLFHLRPNGGGVMDDLGQIFAGMGLQLTNVKANMAWLGAGGDIQKKYQEIRNKQGKAAADLYLNTQHERDDARNAILNPVRQKFLENYSVNSPEYAARKRYEAAQKQFGDLQGILKNNREKYDKNGKKKPSADFIENPTGKAGEGISLAKASGLSSTVSQSKSQVITINVGKLVERLEIHSATPMEGVEQMADRVAEALTRAIISASGNPSINL